MKRNFIQIALVVLWSAMAVFSSCTHEEIVPTPAVEAEVEDRGVMTLIASLPDAETDSRLAFVGYGGRSFKTFWEDGDVLAANPLPGDEQNVYLYSLKEGAGETVGTFECDSFPSIYAPGNFHTNAWTVYFPGDKIMGEEDFLNFSYTGQKQIGNDNHDHIADFHSLRLVCGDGESHFGFGTNYINFSSNLLEQSACMRFNLSGFENDIVPVKVELMYITPQGSFSDCFLLNNHLDSWWSGNFLPNPIRSSVIGLDLDGFEPTRQVTAYLMMSNYPIKVQAGGKFRVYVTDKDANRYYCDININADTVLKGGLLHQITCKTWAETGDDGFDNPQKGVHVLQEATVGMGTDIIIMGDGFDADQFGEGGHYAQVMEQAYEDFFSVEPYASLKEYFNVYYINAVSEDNHDAEPYWSGGYEGAGAQNGAINGSAKTKFATQFVPGQTRITGNGDAVLQYAMQAIRTKGGAGGTAVTDEDEVYRRAHLGLSMVMVNVACHAGTCFVSFDSSNDYGNGNSVAYTALGNNDEHRRLTTVHEAGGHGFGKLADEYSGSFISQFALSNWENLMKYHAWGIHRNVDKYISESVASQLNDYQWPQTTVTNVYWSELCGDAYSYRANEGLGVFEGAYTYENFFGRPTENSIMNNQFTGSGTSGHYFNAISRWAIWYRLMRLTGGTTKTDFKSTLADFVAWDATVTNRWVSSSTVSNSIVMGDVNETIYAPLAPPVMIQGEWINGRFMVNK